MKFKRKSLLTYYSFFGKAISIRFCVGRRLIRWLIWTLNNNILYDSIYLFWYPLRIKKHRAKPKLSDTISNSFRFVSEPYALRFTCVCVLCTSLITYYAYRIYRNHSLFHQKYKKRERNSVAAFCMYICRFYYLLDVTRYKTQDIFIIVKCEKPNKLLKVVVVVELVIFLCLLCKNEKQTTIWTIFPFLANKRYPHTWLYLKYSIYCIQFVYRFRTRQIIIIIISCVFGSHFYFDIATLQYEFFSTTSTHVSHLTWSAWLFVVLNIFINISMQLKRYNYSSSNWPFMMMDGITRFLDNWAEIFVISQFLSF